MTQVRSISREDLRYVLAVSREDTLDRLHEFKSKYPGNFAAIRFLNKELQRTDALLEIVMDPTNDALWLTD